jgi:hypothetical protein
MRIFLLISLIILAGCCQDNYKPLAVTDYSQEQYMSDLKQCKNQAFYATRNPNEGTSALVGGAIGGAVGGLIAGSIGGSATGGGAMAGASGNGASSDAYYNLIQKCMEDRGYEGKSTCDIR